MGGGNIQLIEYGDQDVYLTGKPQITFFKLNYKRHTNFAIEEIPQTIVGSATYGEKISVKVEPLGDLIYKCYLKIKIKNTDGVNSMYEQGIISIKYIEFEIGNQIIDKHYGVWLSIWNQLTVPYEKRNAYNTLTLDEYSGNVYDYDIGYEDFATIPLEFWFCRNISLALPIIAIQYNEIKFNIEFVEESVTSLDQITPSNISNVEEINFLINYIYLDTDERKRIVQMKHEYLIDTVQTQYNYVNLNNSLIHDIPLNFTNCIKSIYWVSFSVMDSYFFWNDLNNIYGPIDNIKIIIDGTIIKEDNSTFFTDIQPYKYHSSSPYKRGIYMYSFCLNPENIIPSGCLNFSKIQKSSLKLTFDNNSFDDRGVYVFALTSNYLQIMGGMASLVYTK